MTEQYLENEISELKAGLKIVEDNLNGLINMVSKLRINTDADIDGTRQSVASVTPYKESQTAYYGETEKIFYNVPRGDVSVFFSNYQGDYTANVLIKSDDMTDIVITFPTSLNADTDITVSVTRYYQI